MKLECWPRNQPWAAKDGGNCLSIMSWNVLAPSLAETWAGQKAYREERLAALMQVLELYASCDILCLQELEVGISLELVQSFLEEKGFEAVVQDREGHPIVNATFFRRSLRLSWMASRSRTLITGLLLPSGHEVAVLNVHLDSKQHNQRAAQLTKSLQKMSIARSTYQVVCGDFNTDLALDAALTDLLAEYGLFRAPTKGLTHSLGAALDHLCTSATLAPKRILGQADPRRHSVGQVPNQECPSDHVPVAATFEVLVAKWHCPALPVDGLPEELVTEWSELLGLGLRCQGKKARKEQKQLEENFLSSISEEHTQQLKRWRDARRAAAVAICRRAVDQALVSLRAEVT